MGTNRTILLGAVAAMLGLGTAAAQAQSFMQAGARTTQPVGHYELCQRMPAECAQKTAAGPAVELTHRLWAKIVDVNNLVNTMVRPRTDQEMWGVEEYWSYPTRGQGDCEDYALEKRRRLAEAGVPLGNLLMTVVRQPNGDGHAVLTVRTSMGDFVLDNLEPRVLAWHETQYQFLKRQSERHSGVWVAVDDDRQMLVGSVRRK